MAPSPRQLLTTFYRTPPSDAESPVTRPRRKMSAAARKRISEATKARWARYNAEKGKAAKKRVVRAKKSSWTDERRKKAADRMKGIHAAKNQQKASSSSG